MSTRIKPRDLVRTPSGRTARVIEVLARGYRLLEYVDDHRGVELHESLLYLVDAAPVQGFGRGVLR